jgi:signal transduction histidine kinase/DNA-binding response OmpR family regulator
MKYIKYISIRNRLLGVLAIWLTIFIGFGAFAIGEMKKMGSVAKKIYEQPLQVSNAAASAHLDIIKMHRGMKDMVLAQNDEELQTENQRVDSLEERVLNSLNIIKKQSTDKTILDLENQSRNLFLSWKEARNNIFDLIIEGKHQQAAQQTKENSKKFVEKLEKNLMFIESYSKKSADSLIANANSIERNQREVLFYSIIFLSVVSFIVFIYIIRSILEPISKLQGVMNQSTSTGNLEEADIEGNNEIVEMAENYNTLIKMLKEELWIKDGQSSLSIAISGEIDLHKFTQKAINFLSRFTNSGNGVFYLYDDETGLLHLNSSFAFTEREKLSNEYQIGEGIIGQVALERKPILLKNIKRSEALITTGTICETPLNTYTFPVVHENNLYGVIELSSFEPFDKLKQDFLLEAAKIISINLYSTLQNKKIRELLEASEKAKIEAQRARDELKIANETLKSQQRLLQIQTEELQKTNAQLEEQHQLLQQQSAELQQSNAQLEEQQQQLEEQSRLLAIQNKHLENSREELAKRSKELELANKYKSEFLANMSHELRTPLNSIILLSKLLMKNKKEKDPKTFEKISIIHKSGQELLRLINDVLDLSKIESGKMSLNISSFHSSELMFELNQMFEGMAKEKKLDFIIDDGVNAQITGDKHKISQILRNFLSNAIKFTHSGSVTLKAVCKNKNDVVFSVIDTGIGIPKDKQSIIFEEFQQVDGSISRKYGGTGLGLSISKKLALIMNGDISVSSKEGEGSIFSLYLRNVLNSTVQLPLPEALNEAFLESAVSYDDINREKVILIIEDDKVFSETVSKIAKSMGLNVLTAVTGKSGLLLAQKHKVDGILLDLGLSDMCGLEVLRELKSTKELKDIPVHIISSYDRETIGEIINDIGYNQKPVTEEEIVSVISGMINIPNHSNNSSNGLLDDVALFLHRIKNDETKEDSISQTKEDSLLSLKDKSILIVDDDPRNLFVLASVLENYGANIIEAENGQVALQKLNEQKIDLILMDIMMPVMDGYETIKAIRKDKRIKDIPIIALTAKTLKGDKEKCIEAGANDYISKPVDYDTLTRLVKAWIEK